MKVQRLMQPLRNILLALAMAVMGGGVVPASGESLLPNGSFEETQAAKPGADGLVQGWELGQNSLLPQNWSLNTFYPGKLSVEPYGSTATESPLAGKQFVRLSAPGKSDAHFFQMCRNLRGRQWYRVSLRLRGGSVTVYMYEYAGGQFSGATRLFQSSASNTAWKKLDSYYLAAGEGAVNVGLALVVGTGTTADVDDVSLEALTDANLPGGLENVSFENDCVQMTIDPRGRLVKLYSKSLGQDFASPANPVPVVQVVRDGADVQAHWVRREGDLLHVSFVDSEVKVTLRVTAHPCFLGFEVMDAHPDDIEELSLQFPVKRLAVSGPAFNATYDDTFGISLLGATVNSCNRSYGQGSGIHVLRTSCSQKYGIVGTKFSLIATPRGQFNQAIMEMERTHGLPCPVLDGKWARFSEPVRKSYLFSTDISEDSIDAVIADAKVGGFGMIIFLKDCWLQNHGHFDINLSRFPDGIESLKRVVKKVHDAGLDAGVHVFGPSISPNDPYVTPKPDDRLAFVPCPPLAEEVDEKANTLTLTGQPMELPPKRGRNRAFPGYHLRVGDEIIQYGDIEAGPPYRFLHCQRGALGTKAAAHPAGAEVKGLLSIWGFFAIDPNSTLADEVTSNFAKAINECDFDMVYFDASDGVSNEYMDGWYYLNKMHLGFYKKFKKDVLYQTSTGTGSNLLWHLVPRSASADGHGDIKGYLDERWPGILNQGANFTRSDIGWYYWFRDVRPDQIEYVCAKAIGVDGSISLETSREALERLAQSRGMMEMIGRYEKCRLANFFPASIREKLKEPGKDFKLFEDGKGRWKLYRATYEEPRSVDVLDGTQNRWTINNDAQVPCYLGVEIVRGDRGYATADYDDPKAVIIETFDDAAVYKMSDTNLFEKFVLGDGKRLGDFGPVRAGMTQSFEVSPENAKVGGKCLVYAADNKGDYGGWGGIGRRFEKPLDFSGYQAVALWVHGDGQYETIRIQFRDVKGRNIDFLPAINFTGWKLLTFPMPTGAAFDAKQVEYMLFYFNAVNAKTSVRVALDDLKLIPALRPAENIGSPVIDVNGKRVTLPVELGGRQAITLDGPGGSTHWPGGMQPGKPLKIDPAVFRLKPGENTVTFSTTAPTSAFSGDVAVLLYRMWEME